MNNPLITILSPCYNVGQFLPKYFETVLRQTYGNLQVVLIDDGSKDNTWAVMQEYAAKDSRVEAYHQENQGVSATRNNLLDKVKGDYVLFVDSDDWIELDMVEYLVKIAIEHNTKFVMCEMMVDDSKPRMPDPEIKILSQEQAVHDFLRHEYFIGSMCNKLLSSRLFHNERFHYGISYGEDALFCWRVLQKVDKVVLTDRQLYHYRMNEGSISHTNWTPEKKGTGHLVWEQISRETTILWPQYKSVADATFAISDMWNLYYASKSNYKKDKYIDLYQAHVKHSLLLIFRSGLLNMKKFLFAVLVSYSYRLGGIVI